MKKVLQIEGMMCGHCQMHVQKALAAVPGVTAVEVNLDKKEALVTLQDATIAEQLLIDAVTEAGYSVTGCRNI